MDIQELERIIDFQQRHFGKALDHAPLPYDANQRKKLTGELNLLPNCKVVKPMPPAAFETRSNFDQFLCIETDALAELKGATKHCNATVLLKNKYLHYVAICQSAVTFAGDRISQYPFAALELVAQPADFLPLTVRIAEYLSGAGLEILDKACLATQLDSRVVTHSRVPSVFDALFFLDLE